MSSKREICEDISEKDWERAARFFLLLNTINKRVHPHHYVNDDPDIQQIEEDFSKL